MQVCKSWWRVPCSCSTWLFSNGGRSCSIFSKVLIWCRQDGRPSVGPMTAHITAPHEEANYLQFLSRTWPVGHRGVPDSSQRVPGKGMLRPRLSTSSPSGLHNALPFCRYANRTFRWERNVTVRCSVCVWNWCLSYDVFLTDLKCLLSTLRQENTHVSP